MSRGEMAATKVMKQEVGRESRWKFFEKFPYERGDRTIEQSRLLSGMFAMFFLTISVHVFASSRANKAECERWCNANKPECEFCSGNPGCGVGFTSMKTFDGKDLSTHGEFVGGFGITDAVLGAILDALKKNSYACKKK